jgi:arylsulfatase A-like enzyme
MNVILLTIDCLRADHVGCLGYPRPTTPNIDNLAREHGIVFSQAVANGPKTLASFPSMLASVYPWADTVGYRLTNRQTTIAEALRAAGYATAAYHSNPYLSKEYGYERGFEVFDDSFENVSEVATVARRVRRLIPKTSFLYRLLRRLNRFLNARSLAPPFTRGDVITGQGLRYLSQITGDFFLWLHYMDVHYPYVPPREFAQRFCEELPRLGYLASLFGKMLENPYKVSEEEIDLLIALYDAQIGYVDAQVGQIIDAVWESGLWENTIIAITADHGDEFREHGDFSHATSLHSRRSAKLYEELLHVPLILHVPDKDPAILDELVTLLDLSPTLLDLLDLDPPGGWLGRSLVPVFGGEEEGEKPRPVVSGYWLDEDENGKEIRRKPMVSCRTSEWKYIYDGKRKQQLLFHLPSDPGERRNLCRERPGVAHSLRQIAQDHIEQILRAGGEDTNGETDEAVTERLRALGYIE